MACKTCSLCIEKLPTHIPLKQRTLLKYEKVGSMCLRWSFYWLVWNISQPVFTYARRSWSLGSEGHGTSVYNGHLLGPVSLTPIFERLTVKLSLPVYYDWGLSRLGFEHPTFRMRGQGSIPRRHRRGSLVVEKKIFQEKMHFYLMTAMATPQHKKLTGICNFL